MRSVPTLLLVALSALGLGLLLTVSGGCGKSSPTRESASLRHADADALLGVLATDPTDGILNEIQRAVDDELPYRAAEQIDSAALPAAQGQLERARAITVTTNEASTLKERLVFLADARLGVLTRFRDKLARGETDTLPIIRSFDEMRKHAAAMLELQDAIQQLRSNAPLGGTAD